MNVAVLPCRLATLRMTYLNHMNWSAIWSSGLNFMSISHWPAVATSWWWASTSIPTSCITLDISARMSP